jgi:D-alanine transaminase
MPVEANEICWFNGEILPLKDVRISPEDRGFQFGDGVYEAMRIYNGVPFAMSPHLDRLEKSSAGLKLSLPLDREMLSREILKLVKQSGIPNGLLYLQLTRGQSARSHVIPQKTKSTLLFHVRPLPPIVPIDEQPGAKLISVADNRWRNCWIKTISLAASVLARFEAGAADADEAVFVDEKHIVAECTSSNLFLVIDGAIVTHPVGPRVLRGITRDAVIECARLAKIEVQERPIHLDEGAKEVFITSTTRQVLWVRTWDDAMFACGEVTRRLSEMLDRKIADEMR